MSTIVPVSPSGLEIPAWVSTIEEGDGQLVFRSSNITWGTASSHIDQNADEDEPYIYISGSDDTSGGGDVQMMRDIVAALIMSISLVEGRSVADTMSCLRIALHPVDEEVQS